MLGSALQTDRQRLPLRSPPSHVIISSARQRERMPLGDRGASFSLTLCLQHQQRLEMRGSLLPNGVTLDCIKKLELNVSSHSGSRSPQGSLVGSSGAAPFPCRDHLLGSGGCHPSNQYLGRTAEAGRAAKGLGSLRLFL